ncbi:MAG: DUF1566 domain-containing protein [Deltaproteobacteria bacterium]|nr:DUF1566 domain-containing protein [Deltaproteobacteria bacterium]
MRRLPAFPFLPALIGVAACSSETALRLTIDTDLRVPEELDGLRITIDTDNKSLLDRTYPIPTQDEIPATLKVVNETEKEVEVLITVLGLKGTAEVGEGSARATFVRGETLGVDVYVSGHHDGNGDGGVGGGRDAAVVGDASRDTGHDAGVETPSDAGGDAVSDAEMDAYVGGDVGGTDSDDAGPLDFGPVDVGQVDADLDDSADTGIDPTDSAVDSGSEDIASEDSGPDTIFDTGCLDAGGDLDAQENDVGVDVDPADAGAEPSSGDAGCVPDCTGRCAGPDHCGGTCPDDCVLPDTCGGSGVQNACGCSVVPQPTACLNKCGQVSDGCGGTYQCGDCPNGYSCSVNQCICISEKLCLGSCCSDASNVCHNSSCCAPDCVGRCGGASDGCGGTCSNCGQGFICQGTVCVHCGDVDEPCCPGETCNGTNVCKFNSCAPDNCAGRADFAACNIGTTPDRAYDICVGGACVSPGCGDATCNPPGPHFPLPDSGQRSCFNNATSIACPTGAGSPCSVDGSPQFCGQDAQYGWDLLHQQNERFAVSDLVPNHPVVGDNVTGLEWQGCAAGSTGGECTGGAIISKTWADAVAYCDGLTWASSSDWRLPDRYELQMIVDMLYWSPAIDVMAFPVSPSFFHWASSSLANDPTKAWAVSFDDGTVGNGNKDVAANVRCVRGGGLRAKRFDVEEPKAGQPVVGDTVTGLSWQGCAAGLTGGSCASGALASKYWVDALAYCESLDWGNLADWRLPNVNELSSIIEDRMVSPSVDAITFPGTPANWVWTSSTNSADPTSAWSVDFSDGYVTWLKKTAAAHVRCVRNRP